MSADETPVEALIGWTQHHPILGGYSWPLPLWERPDGTIGGPATVDELAAWLADRGRFWHIAQTLVAAAQHYVQCDPERGPYIREALVAAVREVAR